MTAAEFWRRVNARAAAYQPAMAAAIQRSFRLLREQISERDAAGYIARGDVDGFLRSTFGQAAIDHATQGLRATLRDQTAGATTAFGKLLPVAVADPKTVTIAFDYLSPYVVDGIRRLETKVITGLADGVRETVRAHIENGLRDGVNPRETARAIRDIIGLAPNQEAAVRNFRDALRFRGGLMPEAERARWIENGYDKTRNALRYELADKRFASTVRAAKANGLTPAQIEKMTDAYRRKMVRFNSETQARTAALDAQKLGQQLAWQDAIDKGLIEGRLMKKWHGVLDDREREEHIAMEGETVPFEQAYSNGEVTPGESTYNCRCVSIVFVDKR